MAKALSKVDLKIVYLNEVFREKKFPEYNEVKESRWFPVAELLETYSDSPNLRLVIILWQDSYPDFKLEDKYHIIQEIIASFDDEATLIISIDNSIYEEDYGNINMRPLPDNNRDDIIYVYENAAGIYVLDNMYKGVEENVSDNSN